MKKRKNSQKKKNFEEFQFNFLALKQILVTKETDLNEEIIDKIMTSFFINYYKNTNSVFNELLEDKLVFAVLSRIKLLVSEKSNKNFKILTELVKMNKFLQELLKKNKNFNVEQDDMFQYTKFYKKLYKIYKELAETAKSNDEAQIEKNDKITSVLKIAFLQLLMYPKNTAEFEDSLEDLVELAKKTAANKEDVEWGKIFTDLVISQISKGKNLITEFVMSCFKRTSKYLGKEALDVIVEFISDDLAL